MRQIQHLCALVMLFPSFQMPFLFPIYRPNPLSLKCSSPLSEKLLQMQWPATISCIIIFPQAGQHVTPTRRLSFQITHTATQAPACHCYLNAKHSQKAQSINLSFPCFVEHYGCPQKPINKKYSGQPNINSTKQSLTKSSRLTHRQVFFVVAHIHFLSHQGPRSPVMNSHHHHL